LPKYVRFVTIFLRSSKGQPAELYHLPSDPKQEKNVIEEEPQIARELPEEFLSQLEGLESNRA